MSVDTDEEIGRYVSIIDQVGYAGYEYVLCVSREHHNTD